MSLAVFFNDTATTEIYPLSLHDALPISLGAVRVEALGRDRVGDDDRPGQPAVDRVLDARELVVEGRRGRDPAQPRRDGDVVRDRKSTRLNSSHANISYAVLCLKKKSCPL